MKNYKQLTLSQRYHIESLLQAGLSQTAIASILEVNKSAISRELNRNVAKRGKTANVYKAEKAQSKTARRHQEKTKQIRLTESLKKRIESLLKYQKWSPELIAKSLGLERETCLSHETIYKWIWECKHSNHSKHRPYKKLYTYLRYTGRRQKRKNIKDNRGAIIGRVPISKRPKVVDSRTRIGDIEVDLMMGSNHKSALLVMTDRAALITMLDKLQNKNAEEVYEKIKNRLTNFNSCWIKTITFDNGKVFAHHHKIAEDLNVKTCLTIPYTSQDKGTIENRIRVVRRLFPKKTDLRKSLDKEPKKLKNY